MLDTVRHSRLKDSFADRILTLIVIYSCFKDEVICCSDNLFWSIGYISCCSIVNGVFNLVYEYFDHPLNDIDGCLLFIEYITLKVEFLPILIYEMGIYEKAKTQFDGVTHENIVTYLVLKQN